MRYNLETSQSDRISFDEAIAIYADDCIAEADENWLASVSQLEVAETYWEAVGEDFDVDDIEEAKARFLAVFIDAINEYDN